MIHAGKLDVFGCAVHMLRPALVRESGLRVGGQHV